MSQREAAMADEPCHHERGRIVSYMPHVELCYVCSKVLEGDPRNGERKVIEVPRVIFDVLMRSKP